MSLANGLRKYIKDEFEYKEWLSDNNFSDIDEEFVFELFEKMASQLEDTKYDNVYITRIFMLIQNIVNGINIIPFDKYTDCWKQDKDGSWVHKRDPYITKSANSNYFRDNRTRAFRNKRGDIYFKGKKSGQRIANWPYLKRKVCRVYPDHEEDEG